MSPSFEHLVHPTNHAEAVVEARIINDMKSHLSENEFWLVIEHLFSVGLAKEKIKPPFGKRLSKGWSPARHYTKKSAVPIQKPNPAQPPKKRAALTNATFPAAPQYGPTALTPML